jgi:peroxiredoxin
MIIEDNTISKLNLESNPGEISESSAETILNQL